MARVQKKIKERFVGIPYRVANSEQFAGLSALENKMIVDLLLQFNGRNNGALSTTYSLLRKRMWASGSIYRTFGSLEHKGFLVVTRRGWKQRGKPTLVALTWLGINEVPSIEYDEGVEASAVPLNYWCKSPDTWRHKPTLKSPEKLSKNALHCGVDKRSPTP